MVDRKENRETGKGTVRMEEKPIKIDKSENGQ
jgi:hypothetical protein